ncbi:hypothetical protein LXA43DRAFT_1036114 [Ganoderma leucocontextum]|nr:hypothetical protein LXA43DRAFT_1036114 [Ganoderma leucocontextum]
MSFTLVELCRSRINRRMGKQSHHSVGPTGGKPDDEGADYIGANELEHAVNIGADEPDARISFSTASPNGHMPRRRPSCRWRRPSEHLWRGPVGSGCLFSSWYAVKFGPVFQSTHPQQQTDDNARTLGPTYSGRGPRMHDRRPQVTVALPKWGKRLAWWH